ncbi:MAG: hypothetical protein ACRYGR_09640 [Janthinobacterium lividum]
MASHLTPSRSAQRDVGLAVFAALSSCELKRRLTIRKGWRVGMPLPPYTSQGTEREGDPPRNECTGSANDVGESLAHATRGTSDEANDPKYPVRSLQPRKPHF